MQEQRREKKRQRKRTADKRRRNYEVFNKRNVYIDAYYNFKIFETGERFFYLILFREREVQYENN